MGERDSLLRKAQDGDDQAFGELYDMIYPDVRRFVYYKVGNKSDAEDIISDAFLQLFKTLSLYDPSKGSAKTWIYTITYRTVVNFFRSSGPTVPYQRLEGRAAPDDESSMLSTVTTHHQAEQVLKFLDGLKPQHKEIVLMRVREDLSYDEIAAITGLSSDACKQIYYRTVKQVSERLGVVLCRFLLMGISL